MNLFIFGLGYTATHLAQRYASRFTSVAGTVRTTEKAAALEAAGIHSLLLDGSRIDGRIVDEVSRADALLVSAPPSDGQDPVLAQFRDVIASASSLRWVGYLSTVGVYGDAGGAWIDEDTPPSPLNERSRHRVTVEQQWQDLGNSMQAAVQIFRLAGIYGPGRNAIQKIVSGKARRIVKEGQVFNRIHVEDIAQVLMRSMERPSRGGIYNVADDEPSPPQDVIAYAAQLLGRDPPPEIPFEMAGLGPMARSFYSDNKRVRNLRIKQELGVALVYPTYREGLQALLASGEGRGEDAAHTSVDD